MKRQKNGSLLTANAPAASPAPSPEDSYFQKTWWSFLDEVSFEDLVKIAEEVVRDGESALVKSEKKVPYLRFKDYYAVAREEIEVVRRIAVQIHDYQTMAGERRPLNLMILGNPGDGKSHAVKQITDFYGKSKFTDLTFNLSQFHSVEQLHGAFHQVRDARLSGKLPLVFWDEFDSDFNGPLGWLRYFIAPMEDGRFMEEQISHPIGKAIFIFVGSKARDRYELKEQTAEKWKDVKGQDFISRLHDWMRVGSINPPELLIKKLYPGALNAKLIGDILNNSTRMTSFHGQSIGAFVLRRAFVLRSSIMNDWPTVVSKKEEEVYRIAIDEDIIDKFLLTREYFNGARSIRRIIAGCGLMGAREFNISHLPSASQISLHATIDQFDEEYGVGKSRNRK